MADSNKPRIIKNSVPPAFKKKSKLRDLPADHEHEVTLILRAKPSDHVMPSFESWILAF